MRAAVLGSPIAHSLSPRLHRAAYAALGLDWSYDAVELTPPELEGFLVGLGPEWAGLSLTMPLKQAVLPLLDSVDPVAVATGAANTVVLRNGGREGFNTDVYGIVAALREAGVEAGQVTRAVVIGGGATAASALGALKQLGEDSPNVLVRDERRAGALRECADRLGMRIRVDTLSEALLNEPGVDLIINTTPAGALDAVVRQVTPPPRPAVLLDVVYAPWPTPLATTYRRAGATVIGGAEMLLHQAAAQVTLMTGREAPLAAMRAGLLHLEQREP